MNQLVHSFQIMRTSQKIQYVVSGIWETVTKDFSPTGPPTTEKIGKPCIEGFFLSHQQSVSPLFGMPLSYLRYETLHIRYIHITYLSHKCYILMKVCNIYVTSI